MNTVGTVKRARIGTINIHSIDRIRVFWWMGREGVVANDSIFHLPPYVSMYLCMLSMYFIISAIFVPGLQMAKL